VFTWGKGDGRERVGEGGGGRKRGGEGKGEGQRTNNNPDAAYADVLHIVELRLVRIVSCNV
jgi:hypothetical protein